MFSLVLFLINLAGLVTIALVYGLPFLGIFEQQLGKYEWDIKQGSPQSARHLLWLLLALMVMADILALIWMHVMLFWAGGLLQIILWTTVVVGAGFTFASLVWNMNTP